MPVPKKVLLVVNPAAGRHEKETGELVARVTEAAHAQGFSLKNYRTNGESDRREIGKLLEDFRPDRLLVAGGDGTINQVADTVRGREVVLGLLPFGSANGLATNLQLPEEMEEAIAVGLGDTTMSLDGMLLNGHLGLHLSDLGLNARLVKNYEESDGHGKWGYAKKVVKTLAEHELFRVRVTTDTDRYETEATMVVLANATMYGTGVVVNPGGDMGDGRFEVITATRFDVVELAKLLAGADELDPEVVKVSHTTRAEIECVGKKVLFQVDGEFLGSVNRVKAVVLPSILTVAVPPGEPPSA